MVKSRTTEGNRYPVKKGKERSFLTGAHAVKCLCGILLVLNLLLLYGIFCSSRGIAGYHHQRGQVKELKAKIRKLKEDNQQIFHKIQDFKNNPRAQEKLVRQQLGWVRENELVIEFLPPGDDSKSP